MPTIQPPDDAKPLVYAELPAKLKQNYRHPETPFTTGTPAATADEIRQHENVIYVRNHYSGWHLWRLIDNPFHNVQTWVLAHVGSTESPGEPR
jgi:hypothetical protein